MTINNFNDYVAMNGSNNDEIIGKLMYMTIRRTLIPRDLIEDIIKECEINEELLSKRHSYTDAFKTATKIMEMTKDVIEDGKYKKVKIHIIDNKKENKDVIVREIKKEVIERKKNPFIYVGNFECNRKTGEINYSINSYQNDGIDYAAEANRAIEYFHEIKECYNENHIVNFVEKYLEEEVFASPIMDIHGKLFFINKIRDEELMKLEMFIDLLNQSNKLKFSSKIMSIPVANAEKYRQEYREQFVKYSKEQLERIQTHLSRFIKSKQTSEKIINSWVEKIKRFRDMQKEFSVTLESDINDMEGQFEVINSQLRQIYMNIASKKA